MTDTWRMFPVTMGDDQAFISFNESFAERANDTAARYCLRVEVAIKDPTEAGMPQAGEFDVLAKLDDALDSALATIEGTYVGRVTVAGRRFFFFYLNGEEAQARDIVEQTSSLFGYVPRVTWVDDPQKSRYWQDLYPTADDWRVIYDMDVLDALADAGDDADITRTVEHWAYFADERSATAFQSWLASNDFTLEEMQRDDDGRIGVRFSHQGRMHLADISNRTIQCRRQADELGGEYDGWETSVERG